LPTDSGIVSTSSTPIQALSDGPPSGHPAPPAISKYSFYDDNGMMFDISRDDLIFATYQYKYILEVKHDLESDWVSYGVITSGVHSVSDIIAEHDAGFFRIRKKLQPYPPYGTWGKQWTTNTTATTNKIRGGFRKK
jgi:hypothetical protein